ncbi:Uncharacterised protein [Chryseobacterium nakagawai]|nr:Uncharacterised protein [Chryseobacterium nakagawai]
MYYDSYNKLTPEKLELGLFQLLLTIGTILGYLPINLAQRMPFAVF